MYAATSRGAACHRVRDSVIYADTVCLPDERSLTAAATVP